MNVLPTNKLTFAVVIAQILLIAAALLFSTTAKADTLICERYNRNTDRTIIFTYLVVSEDSVIFNGDDIVEVKAQEDGHSYVKFRDGGFLFFNSDNIRCHQVRGENDDTEEERVEDFIAAITGNDPISFKIPKPADDE